MQSFANFSRVIDMRMLGKCLLAACALLTPGIAWGQWLPNVPIPTSQVSTLNGVTYGSQDLANTSNLASGVYNLNATNLQHWRRAVANVRAGLGRGKLLLVGDSTTTGAGSGTSGSANLVGAFPKNYPRALAALLNNNVPISDGSFYDDQGVLGNSVAYGSYDTRVVLGANWSQAISGALAGFLFQFTTGAVNNLSFAPGITFDTLSVRYVNYTPGGAGSFTTNVDGGASLGTTVTNGSSTPIVGTVTYTVTKGTHTVNIVPSNNGNFFILGVTVYDSTTPAIDLIQAGYAGSTVSYYVVSGAQWDPIPAIENLAPDLTIICLTVNDSNAATSLATYSSDMQQIITGAQMSGDVILMVGPPSNTVQATTILPQYVAALRQLAIANNIGLIDTSARWISYAVTDPVFPYYDTLHPETLGYRDIANEVVSALVGVVR